MYIDRMMKKGPPKGGVRKPLVGGGGLVVSSPVMLQEQAYNAAQSKLPVSMRKPFKKKPPARPGTIAITT